MTLKMTSVQVGETSLSHNQNGLRDYTNSDNQPNYKQDICCHVTRETLLIRVNGRIFEELGAKTAEVTILEQPSQNLQIIYFPAMLQ